ncbi:DNA sulfur modification protein DndE [Blastomonas sp.]|uniref:DNA sulfur modification protein DndE n=1 Tax=Blastomonas sp. TaxID=1909299 RepID=UPI00406A530F
MSLDHIRLSQAARDQLVRLKRHTGIEHWNVLCRWALCRSLAEPSLPAPAKIPADSNVEMSWRVFGGKHADLLLALVKQRCIDDGLGVDEDVLSQQFRLHLHRGIGYLANDRGIRSIGAMLNLGLRASEAASAPLKAR